MVVARSVMKEKTADSEVQREEHWIHTRPTWPTYAKEWLLELFCE